MSVGRKISLLVKSGQAAYIQSSPCKHTIYQRNTLDSSDLLDDTAQVLMLGMNYELQM